MISCFWYGPANDVTRSDGKENGNIEITEKVEFWDKPPSKHGHFTYEDPQTNKIGTLRMTPPMDGKKTKKCEFWDKPPSKYGHFNCQAARNKAVHSSRKEGLFSKNK